MDTSAKLAHIFKPQTATPHVPPAGQNVQPTKNFHEDPLSKSEQKQATLKKETVDPAPQEQNFLAPIKTGITDEPKIGAEKFTKVTKYSPSVIPDMEKYFFTKDKFRMVTETMTWKNGEIREVQRRIPNPPPMMSEFARKIGVTEATLKRWARTNDEFSVVYAQARAVIKEFLIENGLLGEYNGQFAKFVATNETDMKDKSELTHRVIDVNKALDQIEKASVPLLHEDAIDADFEEI